MSFAVRRLTCLSSQITRNYPQIRSMSTEGHKWTPRSEQKDLHLITQSTPNGQKVQIALEELKELGDLKEFSVELINIGTNCQKEDYFLKLNPNGRIPVLVDNAVDNGSKEPFSIMETAAILLYLAKRVDKNDTFGFKDDLERSECLQWMFWQMGGGLSFVERSMKPNTDKLDPCKLNHFNKFAKEKLPYAINRYYDETLRLYGVLEIQLSGKYTGEPKEYLAGNGKGKYSWADICTWPWIKAYSFSGISEEDMNKFPHLKKWLARIGERPAVKIGTGEKYNLPKN